MQKWLDLLTPSAAALALLLGIALVIQAIRHGRSMRRLESRLAEREGAAARVSLDRLMQLQRRPQTSTAPAAGPRSRRTVPVGQIAAVVAVLAVAVGTGWYLFSRGDESGNAGPTQSTPTATRIQGTITTARPAVTNDQVPATPPPLDQPKSAYTILVLNGSGVTGAAAALVPVVQAQGWATAPAGNATSSEEKTSFVMYLPGKAPVADNLAIDLGIKRKQQADGVEIAQDTSDVDAIVVIGLDQATSRSP